MVVLLIVAVDCVVDDDDAVFGCPEYQREIRLATESFASDIIVDLPAFEVQWHSIGLPCRICVPM